MKNSIGLNNEIKKCIDKGKEDEKLVGELLIQQCGGEYKIANIQEDTKKHIDIWWYSPQKGKIGIDVKGLRKNNRSDSKTDDTINWLEIKNIQGDKGWIFGDMDYIAFLTNNEVLFVKPHKIYGLLLQNTIGKNLVYENNNLEFYQPYQRYKRKDIIVKIPTEDLRKITHFKLLYNGQY